MEVLPLPPAPFRTGEISTKVHKINKKGPIIIDNGMHLRSHNVSFSNECTVFRKL